MTRPAKQLNSKPPVATNQIAADPTAQLAPPHYAGGDDVLALLPADSALDCARALRAAFRGDATLEKLLGDAAEKMPEARRTYFQGLAQHRFLLKCPTPGFVASSESQTDRQHHLIPFVVPGPAAEVSVGIAIAHFKAPLQDVVRAAHAAEKRAKKKLGKAAVAVSLFKRSGEIIEWGCKWESGGLELYTLIALAMKEEKLSGKFPHRVVELLTPYLTKRGGLCDSKDAEHFKAMEVIEREFGHAISRQSKPGKSEEMRKVLEPALKEYLQRVALSKSAKDETGTTTTENQRLLEAIIGLCQTVAFANRTGGND